MKSISGKELSRLLERHGWRLLRIHGSHHIYGIAGRSVRLSVPVHSNKPLKTGLLKHLLKVAELEERDVADQ
jgi:predicted RNA binding protein YcfA (HicA-like mRNA interferase family)